MASRESGFKSDIPLPLQLFPDPAQRIVMIIYDPFLQRNNSVVGNVNILGANLRATLRDVAVTNPVRGSQLLEPILGVERMHLQRRGINQKTRPDELIVLPVVAQHVANVLAEEAFDTFPEFL